MKIPIYKTYTITPTSEDEEQDILDILDLPSLKYGYAEFLGDFVKEITLTELRNWPNKPTYDRYYDRVRKIWVEGCRLGNHLFAAYTGKL